MYCRQCGNKLKDGIRFCPNCGSAVEDAEKAVEIRTQTVVEPAKQKKSKKGLVIGLVAILALVGAGTAFGMAMSGKPDSGKKSSQEEDIRNGEEPGSATEEHASADNNTNGNDNWEPLEYQSDILTVNKVGEFAVSGVDDYMFSDECLFRSLDWSIYDWQGEKICDSPKMSHQYLGNDILTVRTDDNIYYYNSDGELLLDTSELFTEEAGEISYSSFDHGCPFHWIKDEEHNLLGVINLKNGMIIPNLPLEEAVDFVGCNCIGKSNNLYFETEDGVELYDSDGNVIKKIEEEAEFIKKFDNYFGIMVDTGIESEHFNASNVGECTVYDEMGNPLFSYLSECNGYEIDLEDAGDGYFRFHIFNYEDYSKWNCLVNEKGDVLHVSDDYYEFDRHRNIFWIASSDYLTRYYYDENGIYYISEVEDSFDHPENMHYGIRSFERESQYDEEGNYTGFNYNIHYINGDSVVEVNDANEAVDVFYNKDGKLYSFVDGSVALDGDYESYGYAYGKIYAKRSDGVYDIFEIEEYNPTYHYQPITSGEILGNIADAPEVYLFGEEAAATEEIVYEEYASESDVWWCLQNFVDNTNKTSLHYIATGTDTKFDLEWDEDAGHWRLTTTKDGVTTSQLYDDDIIYPIDGTEEAISGSTVLDENFDTGNYYANEILGDVLALDADDANKSGETFSFIGKDSKFQNIYWDVTYNGEFWELEVSKDDGFSLSGYFDENFYFHADE